MNQFICTVRELFFRLKLYIFGIRFYISPRIENLPLIYQVEYRIDSEHFIRFNFYKMKCTDVTMQRGKIRNSTFDSYIVQASLDASFPEELRQYDGRCYFFNGFINGFGCSEKLTVELIVDVYLDFLKTTYDQLKKK